MLSLQSSRVQGWSFMGQAEPPAVVLLSSVENDLWLYRPRTMALLRRYAQASVEVGRLPSMLGREFFRTRVTTYSMKNFEDIVIFVTDMEASLSQLTEMQRMLLGMNVLEQYSVPEVSRLLGSPQRTVERDLKDALDDLSLILLNNGILER